MIAVTDPFMADVRPTGLQKGRGGFLRSADDAPYVTDPSGDTVKTGARHGEVKRIKYGSPSNAGRLVENDAGLVKYKQRLSFLGIGMDTTLAEACRDLVTLETDSAEFRSAADAIAVAADNVTRSWLAADRGSHGHAITERADQQRSWADLYEPGLALGLSEATQEAVFDAWQAMLAANGLEVLAVEASCVDDLWRLAGTLDRIVRTTRPLTFVKPDGELVVISANTVLILDIKFGAARRAHLIQIASYAHSVPYDTDTETRGQWPWSIDQDHALIAHGDFGGDGAPVSIDLVWVDLVAGREHGGRCVTEAKAWNTRDDLWSVSQLDSPQPPPAVVATVTAGEEACVAPAAEPSNPATFDEYVFTTPDRLALVDARATLNPAPEQGADLSTGYDELWDKVRSEYEALDDASRSWIAELSSEATRHGLTFHTVTRRTERSYEIARGLVALATAEADQDEILRALLALVIGDVALFPVIHPGHALGSLTAAEAQRFADLVDTFNGPGLAGWIDHDNTFRLRENAPA